MNKIRYTIADNVRFYRKKKNMTQFELAEYSDLSIDSIKRIEAGKSSMSLENFLRLADALQVPLSTLLYPREKIPETERLQNIFKGRNSKEVLYLLYMLEKMAKGLDNLL